MRARMSGEISIATNRRISNEFSTYEIESGEAGPEPNPLTVAVQSSLYYLVIFPVGKCDVYKADRLLGSAARRAGNTGDSNSEGGLRALSDSFC